MMPFLRFDVILDDLESLSNRTVIIGGSPEMLFNLPPKHRKLPPEQSRRNTLEFHSDVADCGQTIGLLSMEIFQLMRWHSFVLAE